jgi:ElaB/YqjD/DUF883 family membrane-anchored ribosome-binding protein
MATDFLEKNATVEDVLREVSKLKDTLTDAVDDGVKQALKAVKQGRHAAEDALDDAKRAVKQNPLEAVGIFFAAGVVTGALVAWLGTRRD